MTHPALIERITRSLAYMLRHQPEKFGLQLDPQGFGEIPEVVRALNERLGEPVEARDLEEAIVSGDRPRYEIRGNTVRALYGHSIEVEPGEPSQPPEFLYVGIDARDAERAMRFGLRGGRRRFLHLALTLDDAREAGRRAGREYAVLRIFALDAWEEGNNFYDRKALFLAEHLPTQFLEILETRNDGYEPPADERRGEGRFEHGHGRSEGHAPRHDGGGGRGGGHGGRRDRGRHGQRGPQHQAQHAGQHGRYQGEHRGGPARGEGRRHVHEGERGDADTARQEHGARHGHGEGFERAPEREHAPSTAAQPDNAGRHHERAGERGGRPPRRDDRRGRERGFVDQPRPAEPPPRESRAPGPKEAGDDFGSGVFEAKQTPPPPVRRAPEPAPPPPPKPAPSYDDAGDFGAGL